jgi:hypothetical protein
MKAQQLKSYQRLMNNFSPVVITGCCCLKNNFDSKQTIKGILSAADGFYFFIKQFLTVNPNN